MKKLKFMLTKKTLTIIFLIMMWAPYINIHQVNNSAMVKKAKAWELPDKWQPEPGDYLRVWIFGQSYVPVASSYDPKIDTIQYKKEYISKLCKNSTNFQDYSYEYVYYTGVNFLQDKENGSTVYAIIHANPTYYIDKLNSCPITPDVYKYEINHWHTYNFTSDGAIIGGFYFEDYNSSYLKVISNLTMGMYDGRLDKKWDVNFFFQNFFGYYNGLYMNKLDPTLCYYNSSGNWTAINNWDTSPFYVSPSKLAELKANDSLEFFNGTIYTLKNITNRYYLFKNSTINVSIYVKPNGRIWGFEVDRYYNDSYLGECAYKYVTHETLEIWLGEDYLYADKGYYTPPPTSSFWDIYRIDVIVFGSIGVSIIIIILWIKRKRS
ncbi:MAG: hypothetical protein ACTSVC_05455 [Promethearchaeota archaeon]